MRPNPHLLNTIAFLLFLAIFSSAFPALSHAATTRHLPVIHGKAQRPFPVISDLGYYLSRADAWLLALNSAASFVPDLIRARLRLMGFEPSLASLAFCALAFPLDVVTPEKASGMETRVFLRFPTDLNEQWTKIATHPWILTREMAVIWETSQTTDSIHRIWPDSLQAAEAQMQALEDYQTLLISLWNATGFLRNELKGEGMELQSPSNIKQESAVLMLESARKSNRLEDADAAVRRLLALEANPTGASHSSVWNRLLADALHLRGLAHAQINQFALAETDFSSAIARLERIGLEDNFKMAVLKSRAELRMHKGDESGMCQDFMAACALGDCRGLSRMRQRGQCGESI